MSPCYNCGTTQRHSDIFGCCAACHRAFIGIKAFDDHWVGTGEDRHCVDPATLKRRDGSPMLEQVDVQGGVAWRRAVTAAERARQDARFKGPGASRGSVVG